MSTSPYRTVMRWTYGSRPAPSATGDPFLVDPQAVGEALALLGHRARSGPARGRAPGDGHPRIEERGRLAAEVGMGGDQLGQRDSALQRLAHQPADDGVGRPKGDAPPHQPL